MRRWSAFLVAASVVLLGCMVLQHRASGPAYATTYCSRCTSSYGGGPYLPLGTQYVLCCIDFDGQPPPHCCTTERQERREYEADGITPIGIVYKYYCPAAVPTSTQCSNQGCS